MSEFFRDFRFACRRLLGSPLYTAVVLLTIALGIGANTAAFSLVNGVILQPLPYESPEEIAALWMEKTDGSATDSFSYPDFLDLRSETDALKEIGFWTWWTMDITDADEPISVQSVRVSANMLSILGVEPASGRLFRPEEDQAGNERVAIVSHALWQDHYGGAELVGADVEIDGQLHTVVGIMPEGFRFPYVQEYGAGFWTPLPLDAAEQGRGSRWLNAVARVDAEAEIGRARSELETLAARLAVEYPASNTGWTIAVSSMHESVVGGDTRSALWILYGVVSFVLLIACANLANLQLARMESRRHEIAIRSALGAARKRLFRELLAESALLSAAGGLLGIGIAVSSMDLLLSWIPARIPRLDEIGFDPSVLAFAVTATLGTGLLFGLLPALGASRGNLQHTLKNDAARATGTGRRRFRGLLVVAEIAVALVLLVGAGLLLRSFNLLLSEELGFDPQQAVTFQVSPEESDAAARYGFYREALERIGALPGVEVAGANTAPPLSGVEWSMAFSIAGRPSPMPGEEPTAEFNVVSPDYFLAMGVPVLRGRVFDEDDGPERERALIVNEAFARQQFPEESAIGRKVFIGGRAGGPDNEAEPPAFEIVGVVGNTRKLGIDREPPPEFYVPYGQAPPYFMNFVVRTRDEPTLLIDAIRSRVWEVNDRVALEDLATMASRLDSSIAGPRFNMLLVGFFALLALVLSTIGIYGVVAYAAAERRREMGVRIALGAGAGEVFRLILGQGVALTGAGLALGLAISLAASRVMSSLVYGVTPTDPLTYAGVALILGAVALVAAYVPARRATKIDPLVALRSD